VSADLTADLVDVGEGSSDSDDSRALDAGLAVI
jgi:hypothetical protein